ncbi:MAG TPA: hypothetical protein VLQ92_07170 [Candidatus Limnocylindrales bacterium]|nr:hypothetical protein [Candidatus Limnocylindrales bacterium]
MGDEDYEVERRLRRGRRTFVVGTLLLIGALVAGGAWVNAQAPAAVALAPLSAQAAPPITERSADAEAVTDRLARASGRSMESLAAQVPGAVANPLESEAPTVAGAEAANGEYAETLAALEEAEKAAAEQLSLTEEELAQAEKDREKAAKDLAKEEAAAARAIDAAIASAISAAQAQAAYTVPLGGDFGGAVPRGGATSSAEVLDLVRANFPADQVGNAMAVSRCESGHGNRVSKPNTNGSRDFGVFQINDGGTLQAALRAIGVSFAEITDAREKALDPALNVRMARAIWDSRGWQPWTCAAKLEIVSGLYKKTPGPMAGKYDDYGRLSAQ